MQICSKKYEEVFQQLYLYDVFAVSTDKNAAKNRVKQPSSLRGRRSTGKGKGIRARDHVPRVSLAPKTPFPFPFKRLPRRLTTERFKNLMSEICQKYMNMCSQVRSHSLLCLFYS